MRIATLLACAKKSGEIPRIVIPRLSLNYTGTAIGWFLVDSYPRSGYITARDQSMVESGVTERGENTASFLFREWTQQHKHKASS